MLTGLQRRSHVDAVCSNVDGRRAIVPKVSGHAVPKTAILGDLGECSARAAAALPRQSLHARKYSQNDVPECLICMS